MNFRPFILLLSFPASSFALRSSFGDGGAANIFGEANRTEEELWRSLNAITRRADASTISNPETMTGRCSALPEFPLSISKCDGAVWGTLVVGCVKARGLKEVNYFDYIDPFCRVRLSDSSYHDVRGFWLTSWIQYKAKSDDFITKVHNNTVDPVWNEAFAFNMACPNHPKDYQIEVTFKDWGETKHFGLGSVFVPLEKLISGQVAGIRKYDLEKNAGSYKDMSGSVTLLYRWCEPGDDACVQSAVEEAGATKLSGSEDIACGTSCHGQMAETIGEKIHDIAMDLNNSMYAEYMAGGFKSAGTVAHFFGDFGGLVAPPAALISDQLGNVSVMVAKSYRDTRDIEWKNALMKIDALPAVLDAATKAVCGEVVADIVVDTAKENKPTLSKVFTQADADKAANAIKKLSDLLKNFTICMEHRWFKEGSIMMNTEGVCA